MMFQKEGIQVGDNGSGGSEDDENETCSNVPECIQDWQIELAHKVKRFPFALFHLIFIIVIISKINNIFIIIIIISLSCFAFVSMESVTF